MIKEISQKWQNFQGVVISQFIALYIFKHTSYSWQETMQGDTFSAKGTKVYILGNSATVFVSLHGWLLVLLLLGK